jgi:GGDEF domain-containing protein
MNRSTIERRGPEAVAVIVVIAVAVFAVPALAGANLAAAALAGGALLLVGAVLAIYGWRLARATALRADAVAARARESERSERERLERQLHGLETERSQQLRLMQRLRQSWQAEREWSRELRGQIHHLHARGGGDGQDDDVGSLILHTAIKLLGAEKGLLVSREDADSDGTLDVVRARGFVHDPEGSALADRFAREVLARDQIVRDDKPGDTDGGRPTPADEEIDTLVAVPLYLHDRFSGVIVCANRPGGFDDVGDELLLALGDHAGAALQHGRLEHELSDANRSAVRLLAEAVAARDLVLHRETGELVVHAGLLAKELQLETRERDVLTCATLLRAVGYLALPDGPRLHPGPLTPDERSLIEMHPRVGFNILVQAPSLREVATVVLHHHERFDGAGYPAGLAGHDPPLASRVLAVLEAYGALTHERPYRAPCSSEHACEVIIDGAGTQFDPEIAQLFVEQIRRMPQGVRPDVPDTVLDALPLEPHDGADGIPVGLLASAVDAVTLLGNARGLQHDVNAAARHSTSFALVLLELVDLPRVNEEEGFVAGDRLIQRAGRRARHAAARLGGTAYRLSGRRLAILVPFREGDLLRNVTEEVRAEFLPGPAVRVAMSAWMPGEPGETVLARARHALRRDDA